MNQITTFKLVAMVLLFSLATAAHTAQWVEIDGKYIDFDSIKVNGDNTEFWVMTLYPKNKHLKIGKYQVDHTKELIEINCRERLMRQLYFVGYYRSDLVHSGASIRQFSSIIPDTVGYDLYKTVCKN